MVATVGVYKYFQGSRQTVDAAIEMLNNEDGTAIFGEGQRLSGFVKKSDKADELQFYVEGPNGRGLVTVRTVEEGMTGKRISYLSVERDKYTTVLVESVTEETASDKSDEGDILSDYSWTTFAMTVGVGMCIGIVGGMLYGKLYGRSPFDPKTAANMNKLHESARRMIENHAKAQLALGGSPVHVKPSKSKSVVEGALHATFSVECEGPDREGVAFVQATRPDESSEKWLLTARLDVPGRKKVVLRSSSTESE